MLKNQLKYLLLTHCHGDHSGGLGELKKHFKNAKIIINVEDISPYIEIVSMKGHTDDCIGVLDLRTKTLIAGDGVQGFGVGKFIATVQCVEDYYKTLSAVLTDERIHNILFSHDYAPWMQDFAFGRERIKYCKNRSCSNCKKDNKKG